MNELDPSILHPDYTRLAHRYNVCLDAVEGNVEKYIPRLSGQSNADYEAYTQRASYFGVVERTCQAIIGAMTRKPFKMADNTVFPITEYGSADVFLQYQIRDLLLGGRTYILVDVVDGKSKLVSYDADDVINWGKDFVVIKEVTMTSNIKNKYLQVPVITYRELYLEDNEYKVKRWSLVKGKWVAEELEQLLVLGNVLDYIPLFLVTPYDNSWDVYSPPLFIQSSLNIQHFKQAVDIGHYAHFMAIPTFTIMGDLASYEEDVIDNSGYNSTRIVSTSFNLGSTTKPLHLTLGSSAQYTEVSGASFAMLQTNLQGIEERMYQSGSRLLSSKKGVESAESLNIRAGAESAVLETITNALEGALNKALELCGLIDRADLYVSLNKDFTNTQLDPTQIKSLLELYVANVIDLNQFTEKLYTAEVIMEPGEAGRE